MTEDELPSRALRRPEEREAGAGSGLAVIGGGRNLWDVVHVEDVATAILIAAEEEAATGRVYHVVDDEPITYYDFMALTASELGVAAAPDPGALARLVAGRNAVAAVVRSARSSQRPDQARAGVETALRDRARGRRRRGGAAHGLGGV